MCCEDEGFFVYEYTCGSRRTLLFWLFLDSPPACVSFRESCVAVTCWRESTFLRLRCTCWCVVNEFEVLPFTHLSLVCACWCVACCVNVKTRQTRQPVPRHCYCPLRIHTPYMTPYETRSMRARAGGVVCIHNECISHEYTSDPHVAATNRCELFVVGQGFACAGRRSVY